MDIVGIVGSSHSTGEHGLADGSATVKIDEHFKKYLKNTKIINCAQGGKGSELFLRSIIYLKEKYDIKHLLMEFIHDRSDVNANISKLENIPEFGGGIYPAINTANTVDEILSMTIEYSHMYDLQTFISDNFVGIFKDLQKKEKNWREIQMVISSDYNMRNYWSMVNIGLSLKLCKLLNIRVVGWQQGPQFDDLPIFKDIISTTDKFVMFDKYTNPKSFFNKKYGKNILCDVCHFKESIEEEMVRDFLIPALGVS